MKMKTDTRRIDRLGKGCWQLVETKTQRQVGVYPTFKEAKEAASMLAPEMAADDLYDEDGLPK